MVLLASRYMKNPDDDTLGFRVVLLRVCKMNYTDSNQKRSPEPSNAGLTARLVAITVFLAILVALFAGGWLTPSL